MSAADFELELAQTNTVSYVEGIESGKFIASDYPLPYNGITSEVVLGVQEQLVASRVEQIEDAGYMPITDERGTLAFMMGGTTAAIETLRVKAGEKNV
jgi:hypothetical protein